jgi:hypothetical protein
MPSPDPAVASATERQSNADIPRSLRGRYRCAFRFIDDLLPFLLPRKASYFLPPKAEAFLIISSMSVSTFDLALSKH